MLVKIILFLTGGLIALESLALIAGIHLFLGASPWITSNNTLFGIFDVLTGSALLFLGFLPEKNARSAWVIGVLILAILTHTYRIWETLTGQPNPFFFNTPLLIFAIIRGVGLMILLILLIFKR
jgi:hypothetical protein